MTRGICTIANNEGRLNISIWVVGKRHLRVRGAVIGVMGPRQSDNYRDGLNGPIRRLAKLQSGAVIGGMGLRQGDICNRVRCSRRPVRNSGSCGRCYQRRRLGADQTFICTQGNSSRISMQRSGNSGARGSFGHGRGIRYLELGRLEHSIGHR